MNLTTFAKDIKNQNKLICRQVSDPKNNRYSIEDGAICPELYLKSKIKIAWVLKESYQNDNEISDYKYLTNVLNRDTVYDDFFSNQSRPTWYPILRASYSILNKFIEYKNIPEISDISLIIRKIAIINTQKLPALNTYKSYDRVIQAAFDENEEILKKQIRLLNPNVLIFGNTFKYYKSLLGINQKERKSKDGTTEYYIRDNKLYVDSYHPAQRKFKKEDYVNNIILAAREWNTQG